MSLHFFLQTKPNIWILMKFEVLAFVFFSGCVGIRVEKEKKKNQCLLFEV